MKKWIWIDARAIAAIHDEQLAEHGGAAGMRDQGLLESALSRPIIIFVFLTWLVGSVTAAASPPTSDQRFQMHSG